MLVCPEPTCKNVQREGSGVCLACQTRFAPGTDEVTEARRGPRSVGSPRRLIGLVVAAALAATFLVARPYVLPAGPNTAQVAMDELVTSVAANLDDSGTISPDIQDRFTAAAQTQADCGMVQVYLIPASALPPPEPGTAAPSPESTIASYLEASFRPDLVAVTPALGGTVYAAAAAWGCK